MQPRGSVNFVLPILRIGPNVLHFIILADFIAADPSFRFVYDSCFIEVNCFSTEFVSGKGICIDMHQCLEMFVDFEFVVCSFQVF